MATSFHNRLVDAVRKTTGIHLEAVCEHVLLPNHSVLYEQGVRPDCVYFLTSGVASVVNVTHAGVSIEVGMVGNEGFPEATHLLGPLPRQTRCVMQVGGSALRMDFARFQREFFRIDGVRDLVLRLVQVEMLASAQIAACNGLHGVDARLARWLLMVQDRIGLPELPITQEYLSEMLGIRRPSVTLSAGQLQRAGIIDYRRGLIRVHRRDLLETCACECYALLNSLHNRLYE